MEKENQVLTIVKSNQKPHHDKINEVFSHLFLNNDDNYEAYLQKLSELRLQYSHKNGERRWYNLAYLNRILTTLDTPEVKDIIKQYNPLTNEMNDFEDGGIYLDAIRTAILYHRYYVAPESFAPLADSLRVAMEVIALDGMTELPTLVEVSNCIMSTNHYETNNYLDPGDKLFTDIIKTDLATDQYTYTQIRNQLNKQSDHDEIEGRLSYINSFLDKDYNDGKVYAIPEFRKLFTERAIANLNSEKKYLTKLLTQSRTLS